VDDVDDVDDDLKTPVENGAGDGPGERARRRRRIAAWVAGALALVLIALGGTGWWIYRHLNGNIRSEDFASRLEDSSRPPATGATNILLVGSDSRLGDNARYGRQTDQAQRSDTTLLLHMPEGRKSAQVVSIPRDLMVHIPSCTLADGRRTEEHFGQFNGAMEIGGTPCTIKTVEALTGARVDHQITVDFTGFKKLVDALGGVPMHIDRPIVDKEARLMLPAGDVRLDGEQALGFVRVRKSLGDGSDMQRIERQQAFLRALVAKVQGDRLLTSPTKLYNVLDAATKAITTDPGLDTLMELYDLMRSVRGVPQDRIAFDTVPVTAYAPDPNRVTLAQPGAADLFARLRDEPVPPPAPAGPPAPPTVAGAGR
jgi:LCP family protein required for cell wall assembly